MPCAWLAVVGLYWLRRVRSNYHAAFPFQNASVFVYSRLTPHAIFQYAEVPRAAIPRVETPTICSHARPSIQVPRVFPLEPLSFLVATGFFLLINIRMILFCCGSSDLARDGAEDLAGRLRVHNTECSICLEAFQEHSLVKLLPCGHGFCVGCIDPWIDAHDACPCCRTSILREEGL